MGSPENKQTGSTVHRWGSAVLSYIQGREDTVDRSVEPPMTAGRDDWPSDFELLDALDAVRPALLERLAEESIDQTKSKAEPKGDLWNFDRTRPDITAVTSPDGNKRIWVMRPGPTEEVAN